MHVCVCVVRVIRCFPGVYLAVGSVWSLQPLMMIAQDLHACLYIHVSQTVAECCDSPRACGCDG